MKPNPIPLIAAMLLFSLSMAAQDDSRYKLLLKSGTFIPEKNISPEKLDLFNRKAVTIAGKTFAVLQFEHIPTTEERQQLLQAGIELLEYIPNNAYSITITGSLDPAILAQVKARAVIDLLPEQKMQPELAKGNFPDWSVKVAGTLDVWISFPKSFSYERVKQELRIRNFDITGESYKNYRIVALRIAAMRLNELASLPFIEYVQPAPHEDQPLNYNSKFASRANMLNASLSVGGRDLKGEGVVVGIGDNGDVQSHIDFTGRIINRAAEIFRGHASHVTGTIGGAGLIEELYKGYAPKATLISQLYSNIYTYAPAYVQDYGMVITNNSYGSVENDCFYSGFYDLSSRILDQQAFDLPELQHVFAAGNDGDKSCAPYPLGFKTVLGGFQSAKNVLTVGSTDYKEDLSGFSSKGPVKDGRLKPEIMSQGEFVASTWVNNLYSYDNGTSMAAPGVSGGLALLVQRYRQLNGGTNPKSGLMKALLCNGSSDRGNDGPDYSYGFGSMNLLRSITMLENGNYFSSTVANSVTNSQTISVPANTSRLKVLLYWPDPPASLLSSKTLVNDLDLSIITPAIATVLPRILDTANISATAGMGTDHINNIEQVTINNPVAGNYSLKVTGNNITQNPSQVYYLVYDIIPQSLVLTNPIGGESWVPTSSPYDTMYVQWDSYDDPPNMFTLEFSSDNGTSWTTLSSTIPATSHVFNWAVPNIPTEQAKLRITKNGTGLTQTSNAFTISARPTLSLAPTQCEGYIAMNWTAITGATDYEVMMLRGDDMVSMATTTALTYTFSGLSKDTLYWVTVRARINGKPGRRATAISRQPNSGTCSGSISDNDLEVAAIISPASSGRKFTLSELSGSTPVTIRIRNLDDIASTDDIVVSYSINGGAAVTETINSSSSPTSTIRAGGTIDYTFLTNANLAAAGTYSIEVIAQKGSDPVTANNRLVRVFKQLDNQPITAADLPWVDNFETATVQTVYGPQMGLDGRDRYDFVNSTPYGRLRTFINTGIAYSGSKAVSLDADRYVNTGNTDSLTGTFNLGSFNAGTKDIRLDFRYKNHGQKTNAANKVWLRGNESSPWIQAYDLFGNQNDPGSYKRSSSIELSRLLGNNGQNFSSSFQVRWGQYGVHQATDDQDSAGYTFDDIRLYEAANDVQMVSIDGPVGYSCDLSATVPVKITVRNSTNTTLNSIPVKFRVDGGAFITNEMIPSITSNSSVQYTFISTANLSAPGNHNIDAVIGYPGDSFNDNDTATISVVSLPLITSFPYIQNFELDNGSWYTQGDKTSWQYGTPASPKINRAASGSKAWKTNLAGYYNDDELSYLYSPCFDITGMTNPTLSFSLALNTEDCGADLCDGAWVEYSPDEITWTKLGAYGQGTNWYNKNYSGNQLWSQQDYTRWHVATTSLPTGPSRLRLRFVFNSDGGVNKDGIAIDDIHIYDNVFGIYDGVTMGSPVTQNIPGGSGWVDFTYGGKLVASVKSPVQAMGNTDVQAYIYTGPVRTNNGEYYHNRNITIKPTTVGLTDSASVRFYFLDAETETLINATGCPNCIKPSTAYDLGVSKYSDPNDNFENGTIIDNNQGSWLFINSSKAVKVPFDKGYYAEFKVKDFSEFWLSNSVLSSSQPLPVQLIDFSARRKSPSKDVLTEWTTAFTYNVNRFEVEVARGNLLYQQNLFSKIGEVSSPGNLTGQQNYEFTDKENNKSGVRYYRLKIIDNDGHFSYSAIRAVVFNDIINWQLTPNPSTGIFYLGYQAGGGELITATVYDVNGKKVKEYRSTANGFEQKIGIDLQEQKFAPGLYLLEAVAGNSKQSFKLVKQ